MSARYEAAGHPVNDRNVPSAGGRHGALAGHPLRGSPRLRGAPPPRQAVGSHGSRTFDGEPHGSPSRVPPRAVLACRHRRW
jgi:hypothetical protein